ncbi:MAG: metallophosphoesterase family protein [Balneolales bacterium]
MIKINASIPIAILAIGIFFTSGIQQIAIASEGIDEVPEPRHVRVIWTETPAEQAIISWTTMVTSSGNHIYYDTESHSGNLGEYAFSTPSDLHGPITMKDMDNTEGVPSAWYNHVRIDGLQPSTRYYFVVESEGNVSEEYYFITAPGDDQDFKLLSGGDSRLGGDSPRYAGRTPHVDRQNMNRLLVQLLEENPDILALAHGADWGTTADWRHLYWWFEDNELLKTSDNRLLPFIVARGNHDMQVGFQENFWLGGNLEHYYYTTEIGKTALLTLNTEISVAGDQLEWLEKELEAVTNGNSAKRWVMAQYHRPAFPAVKDYNRPDFLRIRENWLPVFDKFSLDLALESDGHSLKRTIPIKNMKAAEDGTVYVGEGGLGVPQRNPDANRWFLEDPGYTESIHHVWLLDIDSGSLNLKAIGMDGKLLDEYTVYPRDRD